MKILLIEDDAAFAATLARRLAAQGHEAQVADNGSDALLCARSSKPDAVVLDMKLGEESGLTLITPLRAVLPESRIVLLTGFASIATAVEAMRIGADDYLVKPVDSQTLLRSLGGESSLQLADQEGVMSPERLEWEHIQQILASNQGNVSETARQLGMHRRTLQRKLQKKPVVR